ncbi:nucleotide sugar dehydrogenase [Candidatus Woesearchaeota archaeon]|nr:nucleotide sugar dehydrogenase [Candidatus Woesearchaeota archaeon]
MNIKICVVGLGYVGLPLAISFSKVYSVNGFDVNEKRIEELKNNIDKTDEVASEELSKAKINLSSDPNIISESNFIIIAVPTPIDEYKKPDIRILLNASATVGKHLKQGSIVVYESTVHPGCTERDCIPILEKESGLKCLKDFKVGYSPERINPGDKVHTVEKIVKVVSGCDKETLDIVADVYSKIIKAGVHKAQSIKVAEAAKIIENTQRDINIALMNELKMIFDKAGVNWKEVLEAAGTKWNFIKFTPGLVGGHCIGVDPYYLAHEAERLGHHPQMIISGRRINDYMAKYEANRMIKYMINKEVSVKGAKILVLGGTFKPNVPDTRNSKVKDFADELKSHGCEVDICEPHVKGDLFGLKNVNLEGKSNYDFVVKAVNHDVFKDVTIDYEILQ